MSAFAPAQRPQAAGAPPTQSTFDLLQATFVSSGAAPSQEYEELCKVRNATECSVEPRLSRLTASSLRSHRLFCSAVCAMSLDLQRSQRPAHSLLPSLTCESCPVSFPVPSHAARDYSRTMRSQPPCSTSSPSFCSRLSPSSALCPFSCSGNRPSRVSHSALRVVGAPEHAD